MKKSRFGDILKAAKEPELPEQPPIAVPAAPIASTPVSSELTQVPEVSKKKGRSVSKRTTEGYKQCNFYLDEAMSMDLDRLVLDYNAIAKKEGIEKIDRSEVCEALLGWLLKQPDQVEALRQLQQ